jgi:antitoxin YefM
MKETLDRISDEYETATITRKDRKNIILMSEDTYNNLITNIATMGNKANYDWLMASKEQLEEGKAVSHPLESEGKK